jgi:hypothetical protein
MSILQLAPYGLDYVLTKGGDRTRRFLMALAQDSTIPTSTMLEMGRLGDQLGLSEKEVQSTLRAGLPFLLGSLPFLIIVLLVVIAIVNPPPGFNPHYPGGFYNTIKPQDFDDTNRT